MTGNGSFFFILKKVLREYCNEILITGNGSCHPHKLIPKSASKILWGMYPGTAFMDYFSHMDCCIIVLYFSLVLKYYCLRLFSRRLG